MTKEEMALATRAQEPPLREYVERGISKDVGGRRLEGEELAIVEINAALMIAYRLVGVKDDNFPDKSIARSIARFVLRKHGWITTAGITAAFEYAVETDVVERDGKYAVDHYQSVDLKYVNRILTRYRLRAESVISKLEEKVSWYEGAMEGYVKDRVRDNESVQSCLKKTFDQYREGEQFSYLMMFHFFYDYLEYLGVLKLEVEEKKKIAEGVKVKDKIRKVNKKSALEEGVFRSYSFVNQCKAGAFMSKISELAEHFDWELIDNNCYLSADCFKRLQEITQRKKELTNEK